MKPWQIILLLVLVAVLLVCYFHVPTKTKIWKAIRNLKSKVDAATHKSS